MNRSYSRSALHRIPVQEGNPEIMRQTKVWPDSSQIAVRPSMSRNRQSAPDTSASFVRQRIPSSRTCPSCRHLLQTKLKIGQPGDKYEQEADRVAEQVMRMQEPQAQLKKCSSPNCKQEDKHKIVQAKSVDRDVSTYTEVDHSLIQNTLSSQGKPLDANTRSFMEPRFGQDFSRVRVHVGSEAAESAQAVNARAYTVGRDVVFGNGYYTPKTINGRELIAHELTHVVQQGRHGFSKNCSSLESSENLNKQEAPYLSKQITFNRNLREPISHLSINTPILQKSDGEEELACRPPEELVCRDPSLDFQDWLQQPHPRRAIVNPQIAHLPWERYVDNYASVFYSLNYRSERGNLSRWIRVRFNDSVEIDLNIYSDFAEETTTPEGMRDALARGYLGAGSRIFPERMTPQTTPRLWSARQDALEAMDQFTVRFIRSAMPAVTFIITMPLGAMGGRGQTVRRPTARRLTRPPLEGPPTATRQEPSPPPAARPRPRGPGSRETSARAARERAERQAPSSPLPGNQQVIRDTLIREHPGLHTNVATQAARGGSRAMGPGGAGADVVLLNGGGREVSVHSGAFTPNSIGTHLQAEAMQSGTTQIFLQVNSVGATRQGLLQMISGLRRAYPELRGMFVKIFGPNGQVWWNGTFRGL